MPITVDVIQQQHIALLKTLQKLSEPIQTTVRSQLEGFETVCETMSRKVVAKISDLEVLSAYQIEISNNLQSRKNDTEKFIKEASAEMQRLYDWLRDRIAQEEQLSSLAESKEDFSLDNPMPQAVVTSGGFVKKLLNVLNNEMSWSVTQEENELLGHNQYRIIFLSNDSHAEAFRRVFSQYPGITLETVQVTSSRSRGSFILTLNQTKLADKNFEKVKPQIHKQLRDAFAAIEQEWQEQATSVSDMQATAVIETTTRHSDLNLSEAVTTFIDALLKQLNNVITNGDWAQQIVPVTAQKESVVDPQTVQYQLIFRLDHNLCEVAQNYPFGCKTLQAWDGNKGKSILLLSFDREFLSIEHEVILMAIAEEFKAKTTSEETKCLAVAALNPKDNSSDDKAEEQGVRFLIQRPVSHRNFQEAFRQEARGAFPTGKSYPHIRPLSAGKNADEFIASYEHPCNELPFRLSEFEAHIKKLVTKLNEANWGVFTQQQYMAYDALNIEDTHFNLVFPNQASADLFQKYNETYGALRLKLKNTRNPAAVCLTLQPNLETCDSLTNIEMLIKLFWPELQKEYALLAEKNLTNQPTSLGKSSTPPKSKPPVPPKKISALPVTNINTTNTNTTNGIATLPCDTELSTLETVTPISAAQNNQALLDHNNATQLTRNL